MLLISVKNSPGKGRGVFAQRNFKKGEVIESCPVIVLPAEEIDTLELTQLYNYYFAWGPESKDAAIALGYGSLYNHSYTPNARYYKDFDNSLLKYVCIRDIQKNEEITINYNCDPEDKTPVWFDLAGQDNLEIC
ncbi:MAG TPA: SET domain-containing protein-lysine N-methyltransferase [Methanosarcina sp.]|jgi:SET domain-containing protein|nr:SET domain-containing protein [Methanosarcina sp.]HHV24204.1 SET domain-containing protein-lysine N-methyltransferase [Methanosarcina sp.]